MGPFEELKGNYSPAAQLGPGPSGAIWSDCPWDAIELGKRPGIAKHWDFSKVKAISNINAAEAYLGDGLMIFGSDGAALALSSDLSASVNAFGVATLSSDGDNEGAFIRQSGACFRITGLHATATSRSGKLWFEARIKTSTITDTKHNIFLGLVDDAAATATSPITALGALADRNLIGFHRPESALGVAGTGGAIMNVVYKADGVTAVTLQTNAVTLVADTYQKLGALYNPDDGTLKFFANGAQVAIVTVPAAPSGGSGAFPNDANLGFIFGVLNATASTPGSSAIDWARVAQVAA